MSTLTGTPPIRSAVISSCGKYRYHLRRQIGDGQRIVTFIMLNPSTADTDVDDPTIRRCMRFSKRWDCAELHVVNLFAIRSTRPQGIIRSPDPVGPENRKWIQRAVASSALVVCAWGTCGTFMGQDQMVLGCIKKLCSPMCVALTRGGHPRHPLYVPYSAELMPLGRLKGNPS